MSWDVSFSLRATDTGAGKVSGRQKPELPSAGTSRDKGFQEQEQGQEQGAQREVKQKGMWGQATGYGNAKPSKP